MIEIVIAAHGRLAEGLLDAARMVVPEGGVLRAVGISADDDGSLFARRLEEAVKAARPGGGGLILTDMVGGTPSNVGMTMHEANRVEILTGANLPMVIKALQLSATDASLAEIVREVKSYGERAIAIASELLEGPRGAAAR